MKNTKQSIYHCGISVNGNSAKLLKAICAKSGIDCEVKKENE